MSIVPLDPSHAGVAAEALSRAFHDDPLQQYVFPDPEVRKKLSPVHFRPVIEYGLRFGRVWTTVGTPNGAAVCLPPGSTNVTEERAAAAGLDKLPLHIGREAAGRFFSVLEFLDPFHTEDLPEPHWYVMIVGVEPDAQGQGLGRKILGPMLESARQTRHPCYLETAQPANVPFYQKLGFKLVRSLTEPGSGLDLWTFRWDA